MAIARLVIAQRPGFSVMRVPRLQIDDAELRTLSLDPRAGFLISLFDGESTVASILDACGEVMTRKEALIMLNELIVRGVIALE